MHTSLILLASVATTVFTAPISTLENNGIYSQLEEENINETFLITSAEDLIEFSKSVNDGDNYFGTTVYLDDDIYFTDDLSEQFKPIGKSSSECFTGTFDGQGHTINNLKINGTDTNYVGLFGFSKTITVKNLVLDSSCSVSMHNADSRKNVGSVLGASSTTYGEFLMESVINMASITLNIMKEPFYAGGIIGNVLLYYYKGTIKNCANYGTISIGSSNYQNYVGGIVGYFNKEYSNYGAVTNCINYGNIKFSGKIAELYTGGIAGFFSVDRVENCVNIGTLQSYSNVSIGSIVGFSGNSDRPSLIRNCYWHGDFNVFHSAGTNPYDGVTDCSKFDHETFELSGSVSVMGKTETSLISALNTFVQRNYLLDYSKWILNKDRVAVTFELIGTSLSIALNSQIILAPKLADAEGMMFNGWYRDEACTVTFDESEVYKAVTLYGRMNEDSEIYAVSFDTRGKAPVEEISAQYHATVDIPPYVHDKNCKLWWWETENGEVVPNSFVVPSYNITLYARWICYHIETEEDFLSFADSVNNYGMDYRGETVYLDASIDFINGLSGKFEPIGKSKDSTRCFRGTFDGQGCTIDNLEITGSSEFVGIFGYSRGMTVRNLVIGSSCSYNLSYKHSDSERYIGGIIGYNDPNYDSGSIANCINMAQIQVSVDRGFGINNAYIGGIAGRVSERMRFTIKNCVNYGDIVYGGRKTRFYVGGIVGYVDGARQFDVLNCANHGAVKPNKLKTAGSYAGGIVGYASNDELCNIENCMSVGHISMDADHEGAILGSGEKKHKVKITHCLWTYETADFGFTSYGNDATVDKSSREVEVNEDTIKELDDYAKKNGWNGWAYTGRGKTLTFVTKDVNDENERRVAHRRKGFVIMMNPDSETFCGWFTDSTYDTPFTGSEIHHLTWELYGKYCDLFVKFDAGVSGTVAPDYKGVIYGKPYGELPVAQKEGYTLTEWRTEDGKAIREESVVTVNEPHTLIAEFTANTYILVFDTGYGRFTYQLSYGEEIEYPDVPTRKGYTFLGWNDTVTKMPAHDTRIEAVWKKDISKTMELIISVGLIVLAVAVVVIIAVIFTVIIVRARKAKRYAMIKDPERGADIQLDDDKKEKW